MTLALNPPIGVWTTPLGPAFADLVVSPVVARQKVDFFDGLPQPPHASLAGLPTQASPSGLWTQAPYAHETVSADIAIDVASPLAVDQFQFVQAATAVTALFCGLAFAGAKSLALLTDFSGTLRLSEIKKIRPWSLFMDSVLKTEIAVISSAMLSELLSIYLRHFNPTSIADFILAPATMLPLTLLATNYALGLVHTRTLIEKLNDQRLPFWLRELSRYQVHVEELKQSQGADLSIRDLLRHSPQKGVCGDEISDLVEMLFDPTRKDPYKTRTLAALIIVADIYDNLNLAQQKRLVQTLKDESKNFFLGQDDANPIKPLTSWLGCRRPDLTDINRGALRDASHLSFLKAVFLDALRYSDKQAADSSSGPTHLSQFFELYGGVILPKKKVSELLGVVAALGQSRFCKRNPDFAVLLQQAQRDIKTKLRYR